MEPINNSENDQWVFPMEQSSLDTGFLKLVNQAGSFIMEYVFDNNPEIATLAQEGKVNESKKLFHEKLDEIEPQFQEDMRKWMDETDPPYDESTAQKIVAKIFQLIRNSIPKGQEDE